VRAAVTDERLTQPADIGRPAGRHAVLRRWAAVIVTSVLCTIYLVATPASIDFASGDFRARLFESGSHVWNNLWFGGHPLPGYGLVSPMLGAWLGVVPVGIASALAGAWCLTLVVEHCVKSRPDLANQLVALLLIGLGCSLNLWAGRLTFGPSVAFGAACVLALQRQRRWVALVCAIACGLSSPVGAVSLAVVLAGCWFARAFPRKTVLMVGTGALLPIALLGAIFPEGGWYPFTGRSMAALIAALLIIGWFGRDVPTVRYAVLVYALLGVGAFVIRSPLGGNIVRLAWLAAGPAAVLLIRRHRRVLVGVVAVVSVIWGWSYAKMAFVRGDATRTEAFYDPLAAFIHTLPGGVQRVEVVPTETFRQADELATEINLARGWETQLDRRYNPELYGTTLTADAYRQWLSANSISLVALPTGRLQHAAHKEIAIIESHPSYLTLAWSNTDWHVYRVGESQPLATNGVSVTDVQPEALTVVAPHAGQSTIRFRYTKWYRVTAGAACVTSDRNGWIVLHVDRPGTITLTISVTLPSIIGYRPSCS
jgi:hypothetical protein